jgi:3' terminal RNA ribose 2'-O-methyltransferase Hen1
VLLTVTTTNRPATDLGYLLQKNPARVQRFSLSFGAAHVFYPEATPERCTAALLLDVDPVGLVRNRRGPAGEGALLAQYVNDRPYVASSFLSVAIGQVYHSALAGRSTDRPELAESTIPLKATIPVLPCRGGEKVLRSLFEALGYEVSATQLELDPHFPEWGQSSYFSLVLTGSCRLRELLEHLYVLIPVLDNDKHYWVGDDEVDKLPRHGQDWLPGHPERERIVLRYLKHQKSLARVALDRLLEADDTAPEPEDTGIGDVVPATSREATLENVVSLAERRMADVIEAVRGLGARSVVDLGCGEGKLLGRLLREKQLERITGLDVSLRALDIAEDRLNLDRLPSGVREKLTLMHGALTYRDGRLTGYDVATVIEVVEHLDSSRLAAFERTLFEFARPKAVVMTTPNIEYNVRFETLAAGELRHPDHRFEWTRSEFVGWAETQSQRFGYRVRFAPVGDLDSEVGAPTQMAVFELI